MEKKLREIKKLLLEGYSVEEAFNKVGGDEDRLYRNMKDFSSIYNDVKFVRRNK